MKRGYKKRRRSGKNGKGFIVVCKDELDRLPLVFINKLFYQNEALGLITTFTIMYLSHAFLELVYINFNLHVAIMKSL